MAKDFRSRTSIREVSTLHHIKPIRPWPFGLSPECLQRLAPCLIDTRIVKQSKKWYQYKKIIRSLSVIMIARPTPQKSSLDPQSKQAASGPEKWPHSGPGYS